MANLNYAKATIGGRLTHDVELKTTPSGTMVCNFSVATKSSRKNASGEYESSFFDLVAFGKTAEMIGKYFTKGSCILCDCTPEQRRWEKDGQKRSAISFTVDKVYFVDGKNEGQSGQSGQTAYMPEQYSAPAPTFEEVTDDGELPFD